LGEIVQRVRDGRLRTNVARVVTLDHAVAALNSSERQTGKTIVLLELPPRDRAAITVREFVSGPTRGPGGGELAGRNGGLASGSLGRGVGRRHWLGSVDLRHRPRRGPVRAQPTSWPVEQWPSRDLPDTRTTRRPNGPGCCRRAGSSAPSPDTADELPSGPRGASRRGAGLIEHVDRRCGERAGPSPGSRRCGRDSAADHREMGAVPRGTSGASLVRGSGSPIRRAATVRHARCGPGRYGCATYGPRHVTTWLG
jgi:hypothetical protein